MTAIIIIVCILALISLLLMLPVSASVEFEQELLLVVRYAGITVFDSAKPKKQKTDNTPKEEIQPKQNFFKKLSEEKGLLGAVKYCFSVAEIILKKLLWLLKKLKIRHFRLLLTVSTNNAANTAIEYGAVCSAVYPVLALLETATDFSPEKIDISTDFDKISPIFKISFTASLRVIYALIAAITAFIQYRKIKDENNERKQH